MRVSEEPVCIYLFGERTIFPPCLWDLPFMSYRLLKRTINKHLALIWVQFFMYTVGEYAAVPTKAVKGLNWLNVTSPPRCRSLRSARSQRVQRRRHLRQRQTAAAASARWRRIWSLIWLRWEGSPWPFVTLKIKTVLSTEYIQSGTGRFLAYIPSSWKNKPRLVRVGGCTPTPFHYIYYHVQSNSVVVQ
jgi:hypothetical protein